jgi:hypothetical protein
MLNHLFTGWLSTDNWIELNWTVESQSYITTDGQSASLSWNKALVWGLRPDFHYCQLRVCWCEAPSLTRGQVCRLQFLLAIASTVIFGFESHGTRDHIFLPEIRDFPFRRLLRLARLQWRYSTPPPHDSALIVIVGFSLYNLGSDRSTENIRCLPMGKCEAHRKRLLRHWFCCIYSAVA